LRDEGKSVAEIIEEVNEIRTHINTSFVPDSLDYLHKGGRVSGMVKLAAAAFKIHPLIMMDEGQLVSGGKYRGKMAVLIKQYIEDLKEKYPSYDKTRCFITHSSAERDGFRAEDERARRMFSAAVRHGRRRGS
jgi:fatty acid-binding protein DegV